MVFDMFKKQNVIRNGSLKLQSLPGYPEKDFVFDFCTMLVTNVANKIVVKARGDNDIFKFSQPGNELDKILGVSYNFRKLIIHALLAENGLFVGRYRDSKGNDVYLPVNSRDFKSFYEPLYKLGYRFYKGTTIYCGLPVKQINEAISLVYDAILSIKSNIQRSKFEVFKKKGLNAMYQNANPAIADKVDKMLDKQLEDIRTGTGAVIDAEDDYGFLTYEIKDMKEKIDHAYDIIAMALGIPVNELTGRQYTSTLGSKGAESIDVQKAKAVYSFYFDIFEQVLVDLDVGYIKIKLTIDEAIGVAREVSAIKNYETNPAIIKRCDDIILEALNGYIL